MSRKTDRRTFFKNSLALGAATLVGGKGISRLFAADTAGKTDIAVVKGTDGFASTNKAVASLGGMKRFVPKGAKVGLLVNAPPWWRLEGSHAKTEIVLATVLMCLEAGAKEVSFLLDPPPDFWKRSPLSDQYGDAVRAVKACSGNYIERDVKPGVVLKKAMVIRELSEVDVFIDIPVTKHHIGTNFSGNLKNWMGALQGSTNRFFHTGSGKKEYEDVEFLSQCIADVNTLRKPDLCIADATVVLGSNGPQGPGALLRPQQVVAGTDPVAVDTYCAGLHNRKPGEIIMLKKAADHGIGSMDLSKLNIQEITV